MENNMSIQSKFEVGDKVWAFSSDQVKFFEGTISEINSWDKWSGFRYEIRHKNAQDPNMPIIINTDENNIFATQQEVINEKFVAEPVENE